MVYRTLFSGICALILTVGLARFAYTPMLPIMQRSGVLDEIAGGWLASFNYLGYLSGALLAAQTHSLVQKYHFYRIGLVLAVLSTAAMGLTQDPVFWMLLRFISGLSSVAGLLLASGLVLNWMFRMGIKQELGVHFSGMGLGIAVSGLVVAPIAAWLDWSSIWVFLGLLGLAFMLPAWAWMPRPPAIITLLTDRPSRPPGARWMIAMIAGYFCAGFGYVVSATYIVAIAEAVPALTDHGALVWVLVGLAALFSTFFWDRVARRLGDLRTLILCYVLQIVSFLLPLAGGSFANIASALLYGGTFVGIVSLTLTLIGRRFPRNPAKAMARMTLSYGGAQIIAPAMTGYMAALSGNYNGALMAAAGIMALGIACLALAGSEAP